MATERKLNSDQEVPDPATCYGRERPECESGMGRLDNNKAVPTCRPDKIDEAVLNRQPIRQINGEEEEVRGHKACDETAMNPPEPADHSMKDEEPLGWDQAPTDIHNARDKRHPRHEGKGGTPDAGDRRDRRSDNP